MAFMTEDGIDVSDPAKRMKCAFAVTTALNAAALKNDGEPVHWQTVYQQGDGWTTACVSETTAAALAQIINLARIAPAQDIRREKRLMTGDPRYSFEIEVPSRSVDSGALAAFVARQTQKPVPAKARPRGFNL